ncbi:TPA: hypothetical protein ACH3X1_006320 [Trebouxia sp. C0004]
MLTSEALPSKTVIATHLYKSSWAVFVELAFGFSGVRNGLLLWKPIEHAFDTAQLCFTYDTQTNSFVAQVLNSALLTEKLSSYGQRVRGASWAAPSSARAMTLTFADIDKAALSFPSGCEVRPYKRVLCYQAHLARREAAKQGWIQITFDDTSGLRTSPMWQKCSIGCQNRQQMLMVNEKITWHIEKFSYLSAP